MNKFKKIMLGALSVLTLGLFVVTGAKVNASTTDYKYSFNGISAAGSITDNGLTVTHTTYKGQTASGTSLITGQATNYTSGVKFNSSGKITFNASNTWTAQILAGGVTSSCGIQVKVDGTQKQTETFTPDSTSKLATINITSKDAGSIEISRTTTEYSVYELIITMEDAAADSHTVTFYDSDKTTELGTRNVADGGTVTSIAVTAPMGQVFDNWLKVSDDKAFDFSTTINDDLSLYASYKTDPNYVVGDGYTLDSALMGALYNEGYTSSFDAESTTLTNTNIAILYGTSIKEVAGTPNTYHLNTGGSGSNTKRGISITTTEAGTITFIADGNGSDRTVDISKIVGTSNTVQQSYTINKNDSSTEYTFTVEAAGTYYLYGSGTINIYYASFETTPEVTVTAYQQEAVDGAYTYVRFIFVVSNDTTLATADFASKLTLILDDGLESQQTVTRSPKAYNKITLGGSTYTNGTYEFDNSVNTNDIYVVYVVKFTTETYIGHNIKASLTVNEVPYKTSGYNFVSEE